MGLPEIDVVYKAMATSAIKRSGRGIVALIIKDDTPTFKTKTYKRLDKVDRENFTEENYDYIKNVFMGIPSQVIVEVVKSTGVPEPTINDSLNRLGVKRFNYLAMPDADTNEKTEIATFIKAKNKNDKKTFKAVLAKNKGDDEAIINFTAEEIKVGDTTYETGEFTARIAGILAGISLDRSATFYVIPEVESVKTKENPNEAINEGELILIDDGEKVKIGTAVNSLTTITTDKDKQMKKIKIIEGMHLVKDDIRSTFEDLYVGKYINDYDRKVLFATATTAYFKEMAKAHVLDKGYENKAQVSLEGQRSYIEGRGISTEDMNEQEIKEYNTGADVFMDADVAFVDAMENLKFNIFM